MNIVLVNKNLLDVSKEMLKVITKAGNTDLSTKAKKAIAEAEKVSVNEELTNQVMGSINDVVQTQAIQDLKGVAGEKVKKFIGDVIKSILSGKS